MRGFLIVVAFLTGVLGGSAYLIVKDQEERDAKRAIQDANKAAWYREHGCYPSRYFAVGGLNIRVFRVYNCEGREYLWDDIPEKEEAKKMKGPVNGRQHEVGHL